MRLNTILYEIGTGELTFGEYWYFPTEGIPASVLELLEETFGADIFKATLNDNNTYYFIPKSYALDEDEQYLDIYDTLMGYALSAGVYISSKQGFESL